MASASTCGALITVHLCAIAYLIIVPGVPVSDILFVFLSSTYALAANAVAQKRPSVPPRQSMLPAPRLVRYFFPFTILLSLAAPWYISLADASAGAVIASHLFLLHSQLVVETATYLLSSRVSAYVRVSLPIVYVSYRLPVMVQWWRKAAHLQNAYFIRTLAAANTAFWAFGLLGFLLPYVLTVNFSPPYDA